ncbi:MAG TPA: hypothetical protein DEB39_05015 [Planctomycetaceae bacterium]|nr:hypothetical protein [Planctomycetaceae bacterium]
MSSYARRRIPYTEAGRVLPLDPRLPLENRLPESRPWEIPTAFGTWDAPGTCFLVCLKEPSVL